MGNALTKTEQKNLTRCENVIKTGLTTFFAVGQALWDIRDAKLYRGSHETFESYCDERWDFSRSRAYQLITAAEVSADLSTIVDIAPERESHIRPLLAIPAENRGEVWQLAVDTSPRDDAGKPRISAKHVADTVEAWQLGQQQAEPETPPEPEDDVIDVDSTPVEPDDDDEPEGFEMECPNCHKTVVPDEYGDCPSCREPGLVSHPECSVDDDSQEESVDDMFLSSIEEAVRNQFDGRLAVASARLETMAERIRSDV